MNKLNKISYFVNRLRSAIEAKVSYQTSEIFENAWKLTIRFNTTMFGAGLLFGEP